MTRHRELLESDDLLADLFPIFRDAEKVIADPVVRNRGTLGGSLCQADPSEDLSAVCTTLDASASSADRVGERVVTMARLPPRAVRDRRRRRRDAHRGPHPDPPRRRAPTRRSSAAPATGRSSSAGAAVWMDGGTIADGRVGLAAVGPDTTGIEPIPSPSAARQGTPSEELYARSAIAAAAARPTTDTRGPRPTSATSPTSSPARALRPAPSPRTRLSRTKGT
jgi:aerobic carbon-monoxide dehydrogenase medium subunit